MKSFNTAYNVSKNNVKEARAALIEQERAELVAAIKKEYGINSFSALNESERKSYRAMVLKMWSKENGMNEKGRQFLAEGVIVLTPEATAEQVIKSFTDKLRGTNGKAGIVQISNDGKVTVDTSALKDLKAQIKKETKGKVSGLSDILTKAFNAYITKKIKF